MLQYALQHIYIYLRTSPRDAMLHDIVCCKVRCRSVCCRSACCSVSQGVLHCVLQCVLHCVAVCEHEPEGVSNGLYRRDESRQCELQCVLQRVLHCVLHCVLRCMMQCVLWSVLQCVAVCVHTLKDNANRCFRRELCSTLLLALLLLQFLAVCCVYTDNVHLRASPTDQSARTRLNIVRYRVLQSVYCVHTNNIHLRASPTDSIGANSASSALLSFKLRYAKQVKRNLQK